MNEKTIADYTLANSIDPVNDVLLIEPASLSSYNKINRNVLLGLSSQPLGLTDTQSPTNKTFNNTNTFTIKDGSLTLQNSSDTTKQGVFSLSGNTTSTTRTYTLPDRSSTIATLGGNQVFTGANSFTGSSWSGGTIDNTTVTVDTISGHTASNTGSIYGVSITNGVITTANSIGSGTIVQNGVQANELAATAINLGYVQITTNFTTTSTSPVQVTGLTLTVTIPTGGRKVKITGWTGQLISSGGTANVTMGIWDGTVGSGTLLTTSQFAGATSSLGASQTVIAIVTPSAGSKTYNLSLTTSANTGVLTAVSNSPAFLLVEVV